MSFSTIIERYPHVGILASISGFVGSFVSFLQSASVVIGFIGACFGLVAGFYTWRIKRRHWEKIDREDRLQKEAEDRAGRQAADAEDRTTRQTNEAEDRKTRNE